LIPDLPSPTLFPYTTLFRSPVTRSKTYSHPSLLGTATTLRGFPSTVTSATIGADDMSKFQIGWCTNWKCHLRCPVLRSTQTRLRSEEHTSELQSRGHLVCRL